MMKLIVAVGLASWAAVASAVETEPCERWDDIGTNLALPEEIAGMRMLTRAEYGKDDASFCYGSREFVARTDGQRVLTLYLYKRDWAKLAADGVGDDVRKEMTSVAEAVRVRPDREFTSVEVLEKGLLGKIGGTDCWTAEFAYKGGKARKDMRGWALVCSFMGRFLKLRYSECVTDADGKARPSSWPEVVKAVGQLMDRAKRDRAVDVYAVADATNRLAAIRHKWVGADNRVSMWKMPNYGEKFLEIDQLQDWCNENPKERYPKFERAAREAIDLRIEPAVWYYNFACALAVQEAKDAAFEALEQAVAAGYGTAGGTEHAQRDSDLVSLTNDVRFAALCAAMDADGRVSVQGPQQLAEETGGFVRLSEENVYYALNDAMYSVHLLTSNECPVVYVNHHENHPDIPCEGLINVVYPKEAHEERRDIAYADIYFLDFDRSHRLSRPSDCPTVVASSWVYGDDRLNGTTSIPAGFGLSSANAGREWRLLFEHNVLGVYAAAADYWTDGIDRFMGWYPGCIAYAGGPEEADKFVVLFRDIVRALPKEFRSSAALLALNLIRHGQKCVKTEADFMSGKAQRPVLRFADIDAKKVVDAAAGMSAEAPLPIPPLLKQEKTRALSGLPVTDLWDWPYAADCSCYAMSAYHAAFFDCGGERTFRCAAALYRVKRGKFVWKVLQGDEEKVRILPKAEDMSEVELEVDYHPVFDVTLADGTKQKTSRVDVGCFLVGTNGVASVPAIVSVYFSPNETREYGKDGKLVSIDYTKRQIEEYCPNLCPKGDWKDVFHWTDDGRRSGWTRTCADGQGRVSTNEFTRDGLVIDTRDALGRPKGVHRSMRSKWLQELSPTNMTGEAADAELGWLGHRHDRKNGDLSETTLAWQYAYKDDADSFGNPSPKEAKPFAYRPELCRRADFSDSSTGFRLSFLDQVGLGYEIYSSYKHDIVGQFPNDFRREDSALALKGEGLIPPKTLKRMKFCKWTPSTNDIWKVETDLAQLLKEKALWELADGSCRFENASVNDTYRTLNLASEVLAYEALDRNYCRCKTDEVKQLFARVPEDGWADYLIVEGKYVFDEELPPEKKRTITAWRIGDGIHFCVDANRREGAYFRRYFFRTQDKETGEDATYSFSDLPSLAIGNTVLAAERGDPTALNNLAVLMYAEIVNPGEYSEDAVAVLLEGLAKRDHAMATYNLGVMAENRGEKNLAARRYAEAKVLEKNVNSRFE
ncbi:MAG: hypothetical protein MJ249_12860 [Kiritimatiellae bacterium]|nr:hypothetical protein [Kiritimatiellia bacterium]